MQTNHTVTEQVQVSVQSGNPSAIGLLGLAMVTLVASSQKLGLTDGTSLIIPWAIFLGAAAQIYAGMVDLKLKNVFGATAFCGYGFFWLGVAGTWMIQNGVFGPEMQQSADPRQLGFAFLGYFIFTFIMTIGSMEVNKTLFIIFVLICFLFLGLTLSSFNILPHLAHDIAAYAELLIALTSFYACAANVLNATFGRVFLPLGKPFGLLKAKPSA